jgi:hypothetical protein
MKKLAIIIAFIAFNIVAHAECTPASQDAISSLEAQISKQSFEEGKLNALKTFLKSNCISAKQLAQILSNFSFEEDKIEAIKTALPKLSDPENIQLVLDKLEFESSKKEVKALVK